MFLEESERTGGQIAAGGSASWLEVADAAKRNAWYATNANAKAVSLEEAYDKDADAIYAATGRRLVHPMRRGSLGDIETGGAAEPVRDHFADYDAERAALGKERPDLVSRLRLDVSPAQMAREMAQEADRDLGLTSGRYYGAWGTGFMAEMAGGLYGSVRDPATTLSNLVGVTGHAGRGLKGLLWMATKQAAVNASTEAALQPAVAAWRKEAGLGYGASDFLTNVGSAAAFGFGLDIGVRSAARGIQAARGRVPILDDAGGVRGWESQEAALERAARKETASLFSRAADGETAALRELVEKSGAIDDPAIKSGLEMLERIDDTTTRRAGVDPDLSDAAEAQAMRHLADPSEPPPVPPRTADDDAWIEAIARAIEKGEPIPEAPPARVEPPLSEPADPAVSEAAARQLRDGELDVRAAANVMREMPEAAPAAPLRSAAMREARAIASLSEPAFEAVQAGASPKWGALVGSLVADKGRHASVLEALERLEPKTEKHARQAIATMLAPGPPERPMAPHGIDDPTGPELDRQIAALERSLGVSAETERAAIRAMPKPIALNAPMIRIGLKGALGPSPILRDHAVSLLTAYEREGLPGVANAIAAMPQMQRATLLGKLAPGVKLDGIGEEARARIVVAKALRAASGAIKSAEADGGLPARMREEAEALEGEGAAPEPAIGSRIGQIVDELSRSWSGATHLAKRAGDMLAAWERGGLTEVAEVVTAMGRTNARDLAARLAGERIAEFQAMPTAGKVLLLTGRLVKAAANAIDSAEPGSALAKGLRASGDELEAGAKAAKDAAGDPVDFSTRGEGKRAEGRTAETGDEGATRTAKALRGLADAFEDWRNFVPEYKRPELAALEAEIGKLKGGLGALDGEAARRMGVRVGELEAKAKVIEDRARGDMAKRAHIPDAIRKQAGKAQARPVSLAGPTLTHPDFPDLKLPMNADGGVTLYRGERRGQKTGKFTHRMYTTDFERAREYAGSEGAIHAVDVEAGRLGELVPRSASKDDPKAVRAGQTMFTVSEDIAGAARRTPVPASVEAKALADAPEASLRAELDAADGIQRMADVIEHCKD